MIIIMMMMMISCIMPISCRLQLSVWIRELCEGWSPRLALLVTKNSLAGHLGLDQTGVQDCLQYHSTWLYNQSAVPFHLVGHLGVQFIQPTCSKSMDWLKRSFTGNLMQNWVPNFSNQFSKLEKSQLPRFSHGFPTVFPFPRSQIPHFSRQHHAAPRPCRLMESCRPQQRSTATHGDPWVCWSPGFFPSEIPRIVQFLVEMSRIPEEIDIPIFL